MTSATAWISATASVGNFPRPSLLRRHIATIPWPPTVPSVMCHSSTGGATSSPGRLRRREIFTALGVDLLEALPVASRPQ